MDKSSTKNVHTFLQEEKSDLHFILNKCKRLQALNTKVMNYIHPENIRAYCQVANLNNRKLVLLAANSSIATHLKFQSQQLVLLFKKDDELKMVDEVQIKLQSYANIKSNIQTSKQMQWLLPETVALIKEMTNSLSDPALKEIMLRIASRTK